MSVSIARQGHVIIHILLVWDDIHRESKMGKQDLQAGKVDDRIPILQVTRSRS